jgi:glycosyltransferase involved in cell wall biosynthesis
MKHSIYIIGNDPSSPELDFHILSGSDSIGGDLTFRVWQQIGWCPTYYACLDAYMLEENGQEIQNFVKHYRHYIRGFFLRRNILKTYPELESFPQVQFLEDYLSTPFFVGLADNISTDSFAALYAAMLGYRRIDLLSIDIDILECVSCMDSFENINSNMSLYNRIWRRVIQRLVENNVSVVNWNQNSKMALFLPDDFKYTEEVASKSNDIVNNIRPIRVAFFGINSSTNFSGGRYHAWMMAEAVAEHGFDVHYITNTLPSFFDDFNNTDLFPNHHKINLHLTGVSDRDCALPDLAIDVIVVVPHQACHGSFVDNALRLAAQSGARLVLINFESPNWFNELSPVKRPETDWTGWNDLAKYCSMIISSAAESSRYATKFYEISPNFVGFRECWAPINTRVADAVCPYSKEKRIVVFVRFSYSEHKGFNHLYDLLIPELRDYTLVIVVGVGKADSKAFSKIEEKAQQLGIKIDIQYRISEMKKWHELKRASLLIFLSYFEGFGLPPVEARYAGTPCICFELPVLREVNGSELYYAQPGDVATLTEHIREVVTSKSIQLAGNGPAVMQFDEYGARVASLIREAAVSPRIDLQDVSQRINRKNKIKNTLLGKDENSLPVRTGLSEVSIDDDGLLVVRGWCLAPRPIDRIRVLVDGKEVGLATLGEGRGDIHKKYPEYANKKAGFLLSVLITEPYHLNTTTYALEFYSGTDLMKSTTGCLPIRQRPVKLNDPVLSTTSAGISKADWGTWVEFGLDRRALARSNNVVLVCAHIQPYPVTQGNRVVLAQGIRVLRQSGFKVVLVLQFPKAAIESMLEQISPMVDGICVIEPCMTADAIKNKMSKIDYYHPHTAHCVRRLVSSLPVMAVIAHYAHMAFVLRDLPPTVRKLIITHDVLHRLTRLGVKIDANRTCTIEEEAELLRLADTVVAINEHEHRLLERMLPDREIITVGLANLDLPFCTHTPSDTPRVLYTASGNILNAKGLEWFLREVWPIVRKGHSATTLAVTGQVCNTLPSDLKNLAGVELVGLVENLDQEFERATVIINCTRIGTGLKIKSIEALCRGKALISTANGVEGIIYAGDAPFMVADDAHKFAEGLLCLLSQPRERQQLEARARYYATTELSINAVYAPLLTVLREKHLQRVRNSSADAILATTTGATCSGNSLPRIVLLTPHLPTPPDRGNRKRVNALWHGLSKQAALSVGVLDDRGSYAIRDILRQHCVRFYPRRSSLDRYLKRDPSTAIARLRPGLWETSHLAELLGDQPQLWEVLHTPDAFTRHILNERRVTRIQAWLRLIAPQIVVIDDTSLASLIPTVKDLGIRVIASMHNIDSKLYADIARSAGDTHYAHWVSFFGDAYAYNERTYLPLADEVWCCSDDDCDYAKRELHLRNVRTMPNVVPVGTPLVPSAEPNLVYIGQLSYKPNEDAAIYLIELSKRLVRRRVPHHLHLVGRASERIRQAASATPETVTVHGVVPDLSPFLASAAVIPVPLRTGGGTRIKILEAMAAARAVVSTTVGIEGIDHVNGKHCIVTDDDVLFEEEVVRLLGDIEARNALGGKACELVRSKYSLERMADLIGESVRKFLPDDPAWGQGRLKTIESEVWFNAYTRLLRATIQFPMLKGVSDGRMFVLATSEPLANASVGLQPENEFLKVEVSAVLPGALQPKDVYLSLVTPDGAVRFSDFGKFNEEYGGLLSFESAGGGLFRASVWTKPSVENPLIQVKGETFAPVAARTLSQSGLVAHEFSCQMREGALHPKDKIQLVKGAAGSLTTFYVPPGFDEAQSKFGNDLARFKDIHRGKRAWLIGNGPSVRTADLDLLSDEITFCFNRFYLAHPTTSLRATYTVSGDRQMITDFGEEMAERSGGNVFFANDEPPMVKAQHHWLPQIPCFPPLFSFSPEQFVSPGGASLYVAMQLAYFMGLRNLLIYGVDFKFSWKKSKITTDKFRTAVGDGNHFIPNYRGGALWCPPSFKDIVASYFCAKCIFEKQGGLILNVSRQSQLEIFPIGSFDDVLNS